MRIATILTTLVIAFFGFAGGGGSSSGGGGGYSGGSSYSHSSSSSSSGGSGDSDDTVVLVISAIMAIVIFAIVFPSSRNKYKDYHSTKAEKEIHSLAKEIFESYQSDWSDLNSQNIQKYTTDNYYHHAALMLELLQNLHRKNQVSKLKVHKVYLLDPVKDDVKFPIKVRITYSFAGLDEVIDVRNEQKLYSSYVSNAFETWNYLYDGKTLKLDGISQPTESAAHLVRSLAHFAEVNQLFYSPDWGRYCLPARGLIFGGASMKIADINNHVIGKWKFKDVGRGLLIQLYTYAKIPSYPDSYYLVGQINVPKDYLGIIVKSKQLKTNEKPDKTYEKFELEWPDFNQRYDVYAASRDALPAFELLNPKFMEFLYQQNPAYNLEVVDNVIYIYANNNHITEKDYQNLLEVLKRAYDELRL